MSAAGNTFLLSLNLDPSQGPSLARAIAADSDGLILGSTSLPMMRMFNPDGSEAMCGNGLRCLVKLLSDSGHFESGGDVQTLDGPKKVFVEGDFVEAGMGEARPLPGSSSLPSDPSILQIGNETFEGYSVFVGNPHWVLPANSELQNRVAELGPLLEKHERFPEGVNAEFAIYEKEGARVRVWERGAGETQSCGTGALAVASAGPNPIRPGETRLIRYPGGALSVRAGLEGTLFLGGRIVNEGFYEWREGEGLIPLREEI
jgi:diaminopimelate epimerase